MLSFTKTGTLNGWNIGGKEIIPMQKEIKTGVFRGGSFLCIPNFEQLPYPFEKKHGEYRHVECDPELPHTKVFGGTHLPSWGKVSTRVLWEENSKHGIEELSVRGYIQALSKDTLLRPGYHPYFKVDGPYTISLCGITINSADILADKMRAIPIPPNGCKEAIATLVTGSTHISVAILRETEVKIPNECFSFCVWSDKPDEYVCIEPVYGSTHGLDNLPTHFTLQANQSLTLISKIFVTHL
jgi:hypothetical protein